MDSLIHTNIHAYMHVSIHKCTLAYIMYILMDDASVLVAKNEAIEAKADVANTTDNVDNWFR